MDIVEFNKTDLKAVINVVNKLHPKWFDENALKNIPLDVQVQNCLVAKEGKNVIGFISFTIDKENNTSEITWMGIDLNYHRKGIGSQLLNNIERRLRSLGVSELFVKTVGHTSPPYKPYEQTVNFYRKHGFVYKRKYPMRKSKDGYLWRMYKFIKKLQ